MFLWWTLESSTHLGVEELGFIYKGNDSHSHSGFLESVCKKMASALVKLGYKVAQVEQIENPAMMEERCKQSGMRDKYSKMMNWVVCQITDLTQIFSNGQEKMTTSSDPNYLMSVVEVKKKQHHRVVAAYASSTHRLDSSLQATLVIIGSVRVSSHYVSSAAKFRNFKNNVFHFMAHMFDRVFLVLQPSLKQSWGIKFNDFLLKDHFH